ncbi:putative phage tail assembly chaperone [Pseudomonas sp. MAFF 302046]|uniref:Phage tail assembly chaperone n=1 Tax=Pseudomonas morbosilactucae TaxID=2938197 RepID=A0ABT0JR41_9PSED|nr:putative phage tail assembly chaperone [Pseudomonas morbosilactucae]MCK9818398.1 putative phage tail assembly chaperone [Pseudomonas morbosilactucae]
MTQSREITLEVGTKDFAFTLSPQDVTKYFNAMTANNKVAPSFNLLSTTVKQEQRAELRELLTNPVMTMQIAGALLEEYAPDVEIIVKKSSSTPTA